MSKLGSNPACSIDSLTKHKLIIDLPVDASVLPMDILEINLGVIRKYGCSITV